MTERVGSHLDIQVCTVRPGLLVTLLLLLGLSSGALAQPAESTDEGVQLVRTAGISGRVAAALDEALSRFRLPPDADEADEERELRRAERAATEVLATEGYFSPTLRFEPNAALPRYRLLVETGRQTTVGSVDIRFRGALAEPEFAGRVDSLRREWSLPSGAPFRSADWEAAKNRLMLAVTARDFAGATLAQSSAEVDAERATAALVVEVDSGPAYRVGPLRIEGLQRHDAALVERFNPFKPGAPFDRTLMLQFQQALQETAYFNSVVVTLDLESATADEAPLRVQLREALIRRFSAGVGFATNTGAHVEALYRQAITFGRPYLLQTGFRVDQTGEFAYVDMIFPPQRSGARDSIGALVENSDIENLQINRWGLGAARSQLTGPRDGRNIETQLAFNFEHERRETPLDPPITLDVLSSTYTWTRRDVDDITNPRRGNLIQLQGSVGLGGLSIEDAFLRAFGSIVQYLPIGTRDALILRGQVGGVQAESTNNVPNKFLFRTGGALTVRGYDYESLGVEQGGAIVGGRALAVASIEYVNWLERWGGNWGWAVFLDAGDAAARFKDLDPALGYGLGVRWRTPAGPLAVDVAYGERFQQVRVHFSVAIAF
ncbi:MAG TPA: BamA/TamA family outer membrane protein [Burkholderiaceae bacterium]|nr:BamA/TamA family outer membrane protein [Burkholderiaceae bacterium]